MKERKKNIYIYQIYKNNNNNLKELLKESKK